MQIKWKYTGDSPIKVRTFLKLKGVSRRLLTKVRTQELGGRLLLNGQEGRRTDKMLPNDLLTLVFPTEKPRKNLLPSFVPLDILYEDRDFLIINKPAGVASIPSPLHPNDSLVNRVWGYYQLRQYQGIIPHIITRLDRDTSGIVLFGKHRYAHSLMDTQLKEHQLEKYYLAILTGQVDNRHIGINLPIGRDLSSIIKRRVVAEGTNAISELKQVQRLRDSTLYQIQLHTGKTHQIRVHCAYLKHPLIGDTLYGGKIQMPLQRQALHCEQLIFKHPILNTIIKIKCDLPRDMQIFIQKNN
ncbi:RluA family pseudouridine synthase [Liquorilactobacillus capillatus]|uniref:Pseudouridine synthase n=1 Tax=Liquorilactobacillus capillatus DSM 19910 TaxID=1423731 RepID=A0A0R1MB11_9LACO|nr:RluA family pseudouridine synthase [Liquorilactobacillus capillatus]KRL03012.1 pseudouridine synthase [Liquorilactobacillus capillatus DSM 19910]